MSKTRKPRTASTQAVLKRGPDGRFIKGSVPKTTFKDHPGNRYDISKPENINPQHSPRVQLRKLWSMPKDEVKKRIMSAETSNNLSYGEYIALLQANRARKSTRDFEVTMNQAEGSPMQPIDMEVHKTKPNPLDQLTVEQLRKLAGDDDT